jgi:hypothetical protein
LEKTGEKKGKLRTRQEIGQTSSVKKQKRCVLPAKKAVSALGYGRKRKALYLPGTLSFIRVQQAETKC